MLTNKECIEILGEEVTQEVVLKLKGKKINEDTINRVLDYLALHKKCFPYLDNVGLRNNLINNLQSSIVYHNMFESIKFHRGNAGYTDLRNVAVSKKRVNNFYRPRRILEQQVDHIVRHELEHIAMARFTKLDTDEKVRAQIEMNLDQAARVFDVARPTNMEQIIEEGKRLVKANDGLVGSTGVSGRPNSPFEFGSTPLNEGITDMKINIMDDYANSDGYYFRSGYDRFEVKVAKHISKIIGQERFLRMHQRGDFAGITKTYQEAMGRDYEYMREFYLELGRPHNIPIEQRLFGSVGKEIGGAAREMWQQLRGAGQQSTGSSFAKSFLES